MRKSFAGFRSNMRGKSKRPHSPFKAAMARRGRDHAIDQAEAALASAKHARSAARAAWVGVFVNALVVGTALLVAPYQRSLETIEAEMADRRQAALSLKAGYDSLVNIENLLAPDGLLDQNFCETTRRFDPLQRGRMDSVIANMVDDSRTRFKQGETEFTSGNQLALITRLTRDVSDAFAVIRYDVVSNASRKQRQVDCYYTIGAVTADAESLREDLIAGYGFYRRPVPRPFGVLDGAPQRPPAIWMEGATWELDESARRIVLPQLKK
jgi:hypothetical protein